MTAPQLAFLIVAAPVFAFLAIPIAAEILATLRVWRRSPEPAITCDARPRILVLMPAHNESVLVSPAARALRGLDQSRAQLRAVVVADNCTDDTAALARAEGVEVLERHDTSLRGKPAAIQGAMDQIGLDQFDAVAIVDADTEIDPGFFNHASRFADLRRIAVQGYFGVSNVRDSWLSRLGELLARVRYESEYPFKDRAGLNVPLTGNGMLIGSELLREAGWPIDALTENWDLYARYTTIGARIRLAPAAIVRAQEASTLRGGSVQRRRWMAGRLQVFQRHALPLLRGTVRRLDLLQLLDAMYELLSPGPILQLALVATASVAVVAVFPTSLGLGIAALVWASALPFLVRLLGQLRKHPNRGQLVRDALRLPGYLAWRLWTAFQSIATVRKGKWERSPRS